MFRDLMESQPSNLEYQFDLYHALINQGKVDEALETIQKVVEADNYSNPHYVAAYSRALNDQSSKFLQNGDYEQALQLAKKGLRISTESFNNSSSEIRYRRSIGKHKRNLALAKQAMGKYQSALSDIEDAIAIAKSIYLECPEESAYAQDLILFLTDACESRIKAQDADAARAFSIEAVELGEQFIRRMREYPVGWYRYAVALLNHWQLNSRFGSATAAQTSETALFDHLIAFERSGLHPAASKVLLADYYSHPANADPDFEESVRWAEEAEVLSGSNQIQLAKIYFRCGLIDKSEECINHFVSVYSKQGFRIQHLRSAIASVRQSKKTPDVQNWIAHELHYVLDQKQFIFEYDRAFQQFQNFPKENRLSD